MVQSDSQLAPEGTIADIEARLLLWTKRHSSGLARVEFSSEFARQRVVDQLRQSLKELEIPFYEINLPLWEKPDTVVAGLLKQLQTFENGVVSISGFATAFLADVSLVDALRLLNFNRERLAEPPLRQIWWMTRTFTNAAIHAMPDLNSWFMLRLSLTEDVVSDAQHRFLVFQDTSTNIDDARRRAKALTDRFDQSRAAGLPLEEALTTFALPAIQALSEAGAYQEAFRIAAQFPAGERSPNILQSINNLATLYYLQERYEEAEPLYIEALQITQKLLGNEHPDVVGRLNNLASLYNNQGRYEEAESLFFQALQLRQKVLGYNHPDIAQSLDNLASLYNNQGRYEEAESLFFQALQLRQKALGYNHPLIARTLHNLASIYSNQGRYKEAENLYIQTLEIIQSLFGDEHILVANSFHNLAAIYTDQGRYEEAENLYKQALKMKQRLLGKEHREVANSLNNLASLYGKQEQYEEAEKLHIQALNIRHKLLGEDHQEVANSLNNLAALYRNQGFYEKAESFYLQALAILKQKFGEKHPYTVGVQKNIENLHDQVRV